MSWYQEWHALSARIQGLIDAASFYHSLLGHSILDNRSVSKNILLKHAEEIFNSLHDFLEKYQTTLPSEASESLKRFLSSDVVATIDFKPHQDKVKDNMQLALTALAAFRSELTYLITDTQALALRITERAFLHLQRSLAVDKDIQSKWLKAFDKHETRCEQLGALHLLSHGVWTFKADAGNARTDLVLNEPLTDMSLIERTSTALVLTEWKLIKEAKECDKKLEEAYKQAKVYTSDVLSGIELTNYRYLVMVSKKSFEMPKDRKEDSVIYRYINLPIEPDTPSQIARKP